MADVNESDLSGDGEAPHGDPTKSAAGPTPIWGTIVGAVVVLLLCCCGVRACSDLRPTEEVCAQYYQRWLDADSNVKRDFWAEQLEKCD